jgi:hypothetical protein
MSHTPIDRQEAQRRLRAAHEALGIDAASDIASDTALTAARRALILLSASLDLTDIDTAPDVTDGSSRPEPPHPHNPATGRRSS